jgi:lipoate-protein ligase A
LTAGSVVNPVKLVSRRWGVVEEWAVAADLHAVSAGLASAGPDAPLVRLLHATDRAVVVGSGQPETDIDRAAAEAAGVAVVRRRTGGGAVLVGPGLATWVDVFVPTGDALFDRDVGRAFWWLGDVWADALGAVGVPGGEVWRGGLVRSAWSSRVCFAGLGPGEVTVGGRKTVGMAQRRGRGGALFQCALPLVWDPSSLLELMALSGPEREAGVAELAAAVRPVGSDVATRTVSAFLERLP